MATAVTDAVEILLQDGTEVVVRPLPIVQLRRFMQAWREMQDLKGKDEAEKEEDSFRVFVNCAGIALENQFKALEKFTETKGKLKDPLSKEYRDYLESVLDMDTIFKVLEVGGGLKLNDPNLLAAVAAANQQ
jgi:hypothetical protein